MAQERMLDIIIQLKAIKESKNLTIQNILDTLDRENQHLAKSTVSRIFSDDGENLTYQYETIRTLADVMFRVYSSDEEDDAEIKGLKKTVQLQNILIDQLKGQIDQLNAQMESEEASALRRIDFLRDRIEKQDLRIEQKDRLITIMLMANMLGQDKMSGTVKKAIEQYFSETMGEVVEYLGKDKV